jgi:hypothetical protein
MRTPTICQILIAIVLLFVRFATAEAGLALRAICGAVGYKYLFTSISSVSQKLKQKKGKGFISNVWTRESIAHWIVSPFSTLPAAAALPTITTAAVRRCKPKQSTSPPLLPLALSKPTQPPLSSSRETITNDHFSNTQHIVVTPEPAPQYRLTTQID